MISQPSAGLAMICALVSILTGAIVPPDVAMTGEVTLRGYVTPIGGVKVRGFVVSPRLLIFDPSRSN